MQPPPPPALNARSPWLLLAGVSLLLSGCDLLGIESASTVAARQEAEGKAIGAGCRHAARSVEQCYQTNKRADKAAVFAGWKEMNDYMRENKIEAVPPPPPPPPPDPALAQAEEGAEGDKQGDGKSAGKGAAKKH